jgi:hypothetical protein
MDFAENYTYLLQNAAQGYHWTKDQCTLHPVVFYAMINGEKKHFSLCFISVSDFLKIEKQENY